jgi:hypothetical protein
MGKGLSGKGIYFQSPISHSFAPLQRAGLPVGVIPHDVFAPVPAIHHMVNRNLTGIFDSR